MTSEGAVAVAIVPGQMGDLTRSDVGFDSWGDRCAAWLYRPERDDPAPIVVMAHGFSAVREQGLDRYAERFAQSGCAVLLFDYRHFGASAGEPRQLLDIRRQLADWASAIAFARTLEGVDHDRLALWGSSFSGGHVLATAARDHGVAAAVAQVPFTDGLRNLPALGLAHSLRLTFEGLRDAAGALIGRPPHMVAAVGPPGSLAVMNSPDAEPGLRAVDPPGSTWRNEVAARIALTVGFYRPGARAGRIRCPLLVCVADEDLVTPPGPAALAARRAPRGELRHYPIGHFDVYLGDAFERAVSDQLEFLGRHLLTDERLLVNASAA
jgi:dienelactone hydrolase